MVVTMDEEPGHSADRIFPLVYTELRAIADRVLRQHRSGQTLQPTALVHEAYLKLTDRNTVGQDDRAAFMRVAASAMRQVLVDHARARNAAKRGGGWQRVTLDGVGSGPRVQPVDVLAINEALDRLAELDERRARVVELRFFGGLNIQETAEALAISPRSVELDWQIARGWLSQTLSEQDSL